MTGHPDTPKLDPWLCSATNFSASGKYDVNHCESDQVLFYFNGNLPQYDVSDKVLNMFYGWWIVSASAFMSLLAGGTFFYGFTVFFNPIRLTFGWTAAATSLAYTFRNLESGFLTPIVGFLADRTNPRKMIFIGWTIAGLGFILMSQINSLWAFYGSFITVAVGFSFGTFIVLNTVIAKWFNKKRSRAFTLIGVGYGLCGILAPLMRLSINGFGWRTSLLIIGIIIWAVGLPLCFVIRDQPAKYGYLPDGIPITELPPPKELRDSPVENTTADITVSPPATRELTIRATLKTSAFWLLSLAYFCQYTATSAIMVHLVPYMESEGFSSETASIAITGLTLATLIGRLGFGFIGDTKNKSLLIAIALLIQAAGMFTFSFIGNIGVWLVVISILLYSTGFGGTIPLMPALQADYFGTKNFGAIMGFMSIAGLTGSLISPVLAGWFFDTTGSYRLIWRILAYIIIPAIPLVLSARSPRPTQKLTLKS